jgi:predicted PurR-regulated permease PerM
MAARWAANGLAARLAGWPKQDDVRRSETPPDETRPRETLPSNAGDSGMGDSAMGDSGIGDSGVGDAGDRAARGFYPGVPRWLYTGAAWGWRLILLGFAVYLLARIASMLYLVVVPCTAALLLTALLQPLASRLRRVGFGSMAATWTALLLAIVVLAGVGVVVTERVQAEYPVLVPQVRNTSIQLQSWLAGPPFHLHTTNVEGVIDNFVKYLSQHQSLVEGTVVTGGRIVAEVLGGMVLMLFVTFFLIKDGESIWRWLTSGFHGERRARVNRAGHAAWQAAVHYIRGTVMVAGIHAVVMGVLLSIMNAPLVAPLALLMFIAAFVPLVGALVAGSLAILVVLAAKGWIMALVVLAVLIVMSQLEGHLLQPQVVGKMVRLHPLAVILVLASGGVVAGIYGAIIAVPITAAVTRAMHEFRVAPAPPSGQADPVQADPVQPPPVQPPSSPGQAAPPVTHPPVTPPPENGHRAP